MSIRLVFGVLSLVIGVSALGVVGCGAGATATTHSETTPTTASAAALPAGVQSIKDAGVLRVGVKSDVPGLSLQNPSTGTFEGMEVDLAYSLAERMGLTKDAVRLQAVTTADRGPLLDGGKIDVAIATFSISPERLVQWNFSNPYYRDSVGLLVVQASGFKSLVDLAGKKIGVAKATTTQADVQAAADRAGVKVEFVEFSTYPEVAAALKSAAIDSFATNKSILAYYATPDTVVLPDSLAERDFGIASKKGTDDLTTFINGMLDEMKANGAMAALYSKWGLK